MILVALKHEYRAIQPLLKGREVLRAEAFKYERGSIAGVPVAAAVTGVGKSRAAARCAELVDRERPWGIILAGFAGGLRDDLATGDLVIAGEIREVGAAGRAGEARWTAARESLEAAARITIPGHRVVPGILAAVDRVYLTPAEKRELALASGADAVDMESSAVARAAAGIPFLCARAILDEVDFPLPIDFSRTLAPSGEPSPWRIFKEVARRPAKLFRTLDLGTRARIALQTLRAALPQLAEAMGMQRPTGG